jgi:hypothetical protein
LPVCQFRLFEFGHSTASAGVQGELDRQTNLLPHPLHDLLHSGKRVGFENAVLDLVQYHRDSTPSQFGKDRLRLRIELYVTVFQRMVDYRASFVMFNPDRQLLAGPIAGPT